MVEAPESGEHPAQLLVKVSDDGRGGARLGSGSGLRGLDDRVAALGGTLVLESPIGGGALLLASLPLESRPLT